MYAVPVDLHLAHCGLRLGKRTCNPLIGWMANTEVASCALLLETGKAYLHTTEHDRDMHFANVVEVKPSIRRWRPRTHQENYKIQ